METLPFFPGSFHSQEGKVFYSETRMQDLKTIVELSHEFGTPEYVKGGGGNTSYKNEDTLWVKPSGTTLAGLQEDTFVTLNRTKVNELYDVKTPEEPHARVNHLVGQVHFQFRQVSESLTAVVFNLSEGEGPTRIGCGVFV